MEILNWAVFVSQTGSEILTLSKKLGVVPRFLFTNNYKKLKSEVTIHIISNGGFVIKLPFIPSPEDYMNEMIMNTSLITLHGYLRIIPESFISKYKGKCFNGHPGLISQYENLKGKDPQIKMWENKHLYKRIGSVVHEVTPQVDEGKIIEEYSVFNTVSSLDEAYDTLKYTSLECWKQFFSNNIINNLENYK